MLCNCELGKPLPAPPRLHRLFRAEGDTICLWISLLDLEGIHELRESPVYEMVTVVRVAVATLTITTTLTLTLTQPKQQP